MLGQISVLRPQGHVQVHIIGRGSGVVQTCGCTRCARVVSLYLVLRCTENFSNLFGSVYFLGSVSGKHGAVGVGAGGVRSGMTPQRSRATSVVGTELPLKMDFDLQATTWVEECIKSGYKKYEGEHPLGTPRVDTTIFYHAAKTHSPVALRAA